MKPPAPVALPDPSHTPQVAADIQLAALRDNDTPEPDSGLATVHAFLTPGAPDYAPFAAAWGPRLRSLFRPEDVYTLRTVRTGDYTATVTLEIQREGAPTVLFHMGHLVPFVSTPGTCSQPCWLTHNIECPDTG